MTFNNCKKIMTGLKMKPRKRPKDKKDEDDEERKNETGTVPDIN
jgi:hypothetical protein